MLGSVVTVELRDRQQKGKANFSKESKSWQTQRNRKMPPKT